MEGVKLDNSQLSTFDITKITLAKLSNQVIKWHAQVTVLDMIVKSGHKNIRTESNTILTDHHVIGLTVSVLSFCACRGVGGYQRLRDPKL